MLDKLRTLETLIVSMNKQYHVVATELANLKNKPNNDAKNEALIDKLTQAFNQSQDSLKASDAVVNKLQTELAEANKQNEILHKQNQELSEENNELKQKNRLAIERAELIQTWLYNIDNAQSNQP